MKKDYVVYLTKEESNYTNTHPEEYIHIPLPHSDNGKGRRMSDWFIGKSVTEMQTLLKDYEKNGRNDFARNLMNEALERQGNAPVF